MSMQTALKGSYEVLRESAKVHREHRCLSSAAQCDLQADAVLKYIDDAECHHSPARKETSDG